MPPGPALAFAAAVDVAVCTGHCLHFSNWFASISLSAYHGPAALASVARDRPVIHGLRELPTLFEALSPVLRVWHAACIERTMRHCRRYWRDCWKPRICWDGTRLLQHDHGGALRNADSDCVRRTISFQTKTIRKQLYQLISGLPTSFWPPPCPITPGAQLASEVLASSGRMQDTLYSHRA